MEMESVVKTFFVLWYSPVILMMRLPIMHAFFRALFTAASSSYSRTHPNILPIFFFFFDNGTKAIFFSSFDIGTEAIRGHFWNILCSKYISQLKLKLDSNYIVPYLMNSRCTHQIFTEYISGDWTCNLWEQVQSTNQYTVKAWR